MARNGATVVGVDLNSWRVNFATQLVQSRYPHWEIAGLTATPVEDLPRDEPFDYIVSKDTFEHVDDLTGLVEALYQLLKPGGIDCRVDPPLLVAEGGSRVHRAAHTQLARRAAGPDSPGGGQ